MKSGSEDGAVAYRQFEESDNPYDVKFAHPTSGNASVGPLQQVNKDARDKKPEKPAPATSSGDAERHHP